MDKIGKIDKSLEEEVKNYFQGYWPGTETVEQCNTDLHFTPPAIIRLARHFAEWGAEHYCELTKKIGDSSEIPNHLNVMADYARRQTEELLDVIKKYDDYSDEQIEELRTHLMAMFLEGAGWQEKQMMKEAVEGEVYKFGEIAYVKERNNAELTKYLSQFNNGDKVRIIVLKEEEE